MRTCKTSPRSRSDNTMQIQIQNGMVWRNATAITFAGGLSDKLLDLLAWQQHIDRIVRKTDRDDRRDDAWRVGREV